MARNNTATKTDTRQLLIKTASDLMRERDTLDITLVDIAQRSGMNSALVAYHFGNKEGLQIAVLENDIAESRAAIGILASSDHPPDTKMRIYLAAMTNVFYRAPYYVRLIQAMTTTAADDTLTRIANELVKPIIETQKSILQEGMRKGIFVKLDPMLFYFQTVGATSDIYGQRFVLEKAYGHPPMTPALHARYKKQIVGLLMRSILRDPPADLS